MNAKDPVIQNPVVRAESVGVDLREFFLGFLRSFDKLEKMRRVHPSCVFTAIDCSIERLKCIKIAEELEVADTKPTIVFGRGLRDGFVARYALLELLKKDPTLDLAL